jgi:hypothetical protein
MVGAGVGTQYLVSMYNEYLSIMEGGKEGRKGGII